MYEITTVRTIASDDQSHEHIDLIGYLSAHIEGEPITIGIPRVLQKIAFGESFCVTNDGERAEVKRGTCEICAFEPYLVTAADRPGDNKILALPSS